MRKIFFILFIILLNSRTYGHEGISSIGLDGRNIATVVSSDFSKFPLDETLSGLSVVEKTWYVYKEGNWSDTLTWTLDGSALPTYDNEQGETPGKNDLVVIAFNKVVTIQPTTSAIGIGQIEVRGTLNLTSSTGHNFEKIIGDGVITTTSTTDNFPSGLSSSFSDPSLGGTFEVKGLGIILSTIRSYNNLRINLDNPTDVAVLLSDYTINGQLTIDNGIFQINDNDSTTPLRLTVNDLLVETNGKITVGTASTIGAYSITPDNLPANDYHKIFHQLYIGNDFTNKGSVRLTNQNNPDYASLYDGGAATVFFTNSTTNSAVSLLGVTDFYNLVVDKSNREVEINSNNLLNFSLFGANHASFQGNEIRKSLWIKNGTLKLTGDILIPSLTEGNKAGGEYRIGENARLWIAESGVEVYTTAMSSQTSVDNHAGVTDFFTEEESLVLEGKCLVSNGKLSTNNAEGIILGASASMELSGGLVEASSLVVKENSSSSYKQTGGTLTLTGINTNGDFDFGISSVSFKMEGGEIILDKGSFILGSTPSNYSVSGGKLIFNMSENATINTTANLWDLQLQNQTTTDDTDTLMMEHGLIVSNDLIIKSYTQLNSDPVNNYDLTVGSNFSIESEGASEKYIANSNTTRLEGIKTSNFNFGTNTVNFHNLIINKKEEALVVIESGASAPLSAIKIHADFRLESGMLDYGIFNIESTGDVYIGDTLGRAIDPGKLILNSTLGAQNITSTGGLIATMEIDNTKNVFLEGDLSLVKLIMTNGLFDINSFKLRLEGPSSTITGTIWGPTKMIRMAGNFSDGGLEFYLNKDKTLLYPIGTNANSRLRYTPLRARFTSISPTDDGYVRVNIGDEELASSNIAGNGDILSYYWRVRHHGFNTLPEVAEYVFTHASADRDGKVATNWQSGSVLDIFPYERKNENNYDEATRKITFGGLMPSFNLENASYTAGDISNFTGSVDVYYTRSSRVTFVNPKGWSLNEPDGTGVQQKPSERSIVVVQNGDWLQVEEYSAEVIPTLSAIIFDKKEGKIGGKVQFFRSGPYNIGRVSGTGVVGFKARNDPNVQGDFGDFANDPASTYFYFGSGTRRITNIPNLIPNLLIENIDLAINKEIKVKGNLTIQNGGAFTPLKRAEIMGDLEIGAWGGGTLSFPSGGSPVTVTVHGNVDFSYQIKGGSLTSSRTLKVLSGGSRYLEHRLIVKGDVLKTGRSPSFMDLYTSPIEANVILELSGEGSHRLVNTTTGSIPSLYQVVVNKGNDQSSQFSFDGNFNLYGSKNQEKKALTLKNGTLRLNHEDINTALTTGGDFTIPGSAALQVTKGKVSVRGDDTGILLDGSLIIDGGSVNMDDQASNGNNYIEYSTSGNSRIIVRSGTLTVGSQIRRSTSSISGVLSYTQRGGTVVVGKNASPESKRAVFEVLNKGSHMTFVGGTFTLVRQNGLAPTISALYLDPETSSFTGSTISVGNVDTPINQQDFNVSITPPIHNIIFSGNTSTSKLKDRGLTVLGDITINNAHTLDGNGYALTLQGNFTNDGAYVTNENTTLFSGPVAQSYNGSGTGSFYNLTKFNSSTLAIGKDISITNHLLLSGGIVNTLDNKIVVEGDAEINSSIISTSGDGLVFSGGENQLLERSILGTSRIDILTIDNSQGVNISSLNKNFLINKALRLSSGVFNTANNLLMISGSCSIVPVNPYTATNMIKINKSYGIKKFITPSTSSFIFPIGEEVYMPLTLSVTSTDAGSITVRPNNEIYSGIFENRETPDPEIVDKENVLQYYWRIDSEGISSITGNIEFTYNPLDVLVTEPYTLANYIPARLSHNAIEWDHFEETEFDEVTSKFTVDFTNSSSLDIGGVYTAGVGSDNGGNFINGAIPNEPLIPYRTDAGGRLNFSNNRNQWNFRPPLGGPLGSKVIVSSGDELVLDNNNIDLLSIEIEPGATLTVDNTTLHRLGEVTGEGTLKIVSNTTDASFPTGDYSTFLNNSEEGGSGSLEFSGSGDYTIMSRTSIVKGLKLTGSGTVSLSNNDITVNNFELGGTVTFTNPLEKSISIEKNLIIGSGHFSSSGIITVENTATISGGTFDNGTSSLTINDTLLITSGTFDVGDGGSVSLRGDVSNTGGTFIGGTNSSIVKLVGSTTQKLTGDFTSFNKFHRLEINNNNGIELYNSIEVGDELNLLNGVINTQSDTVILGVTTEVIPEGGSNTSFVEGIVSKKDIPEGGGFTFPIGREGVLRKIAIKDVTIGGETWDAYFSVENRNPISMQTYDTLIESMYLKGDWHLSDGHNSPQDMQANIGLFWNLDNDPSSVSELSVMAQDENTLIWHNKGSKNIELLEGRFESGEPINFSSRVITLGSTQPEGALFIANESSLSVLPITLLYFNTKVFASTVSLLWETASELNNQAFTLLRSKDGENFEILTTIEGAGTSSEKHSYSYVDEHPYSGISYYKLVQTDFDNTSLEVGLRLVKRPHTLEESQVSVYPNPFNNGKVTIAIKGLNREERVTLSILDVLGKLKYTSEEKTNSSGLLSVSIDQVMSWSKGVYIIVVETEKGVLKTKIFRH